MISQRLVITTTIKTDYNSKQIAKEWASCLGYSFVERRGVSLEEIKETTGATAIIVYSTTQAKLYSNDQQFFFHPSLAKLRINTLKKNGTDQMVRAMQLKPGERLLDCTLGLATDSLVAAHVLGPAGQVIGIEAVPEIAALVRIGIALELGSNRNKWARDMCGLEVICADHRQYLQELPTESVDIVYFDPMFQKPQKTTGAIEALRPFARKITLERETIDNALRVARRRVVLKERRHSTEFSRLGFDCVIGGKHSPIAFGVIDKEGGENDST